LDREEGTTEYTEYTEGLMRFGTTKKSKEAKGNSRGVEKLKH
jgi:hypothetical protein